jgi:hypothetical protein
MSTLTVGSASGDPPGATKVSASNYPIIAVIDRERSEALYLNAR